MERTNHTRANRARRALGGGFAALHPDDRQDAMVDLLADLRHLANEEGFAFGDMIALADRHYSAEARA